MHPNHLLKTLVLTAGDFGTAVGDRLQTSLGASVLPLLEVVDNLATVIKQYDYIAVAAWRPYIKIFREIDSLCFEHNVRWSVVDISSQLLRCGPLVVPGYGACYHCFISRITSHYTAVERENVIEGNLERNENLGLAGFIQPMIDIAASALIEDARAPTHKASRFRFVDVLASSVRESEVIGIHNCPRCRPKPAGFDQTRRFIDVMLPSLGEILE